MSSNYGDTEKYTLWEAPISFCFSLTQEIMGGLEDKEYFSDESFGMGEADSRNLEIVG